MENQVLQSEPCYLSFEGIVENTMRRYGIDMDVTEFLDLYYLITQHYYLYHIGGVRTSEENFQEN